MKHTPSISQYAVDAAGFDDPGDVSPMNDDERTVSTRKWWTPWHELVGANGILAQSGRIRVRLSDDQWMIDRFNKQWKPISFHRDCESLKRVLGEKSRMKANAHLASDYLEVRGRLEAL
ncbi:MAG: hypothetical protein RID11_12340 [Roseovarius sp.]|jgi:hypothetical protein|uniref:hypothetical protein n=1 Tax=Roseovarius sp. TaxID=1486281 RepID=UPI0032EE0998